MSLLGWVDFSSEDREQVSKILAMLREPGTLDELGIGQIRDAFADLLFPGFSTIQTRAKYLITVPRIFRDYHLLTTAQKKKKPLSHYLKEIENEVAKRLVEKHGKDENGIIGSTMIHNGGVSRRPSSVYWNAFRQFGIIDDNISLKEFCVQYAKNNFSEIEVSEHEEGIDDEGHGRLKNKVKIPSFKENWLENISLELDKEEADFLYLYMIQSSYIKDSIPAQLFKHDLIDTALEKKHHTIAHLSMLILHDKNVSSQCKETLNYANEFSLAMEGSHIRYNILIARKNGHDENMKKYEKAFASWQEEVKQQNIFYAECAESWLMAASKEHRHPFKLKTTRFIKEWCKLMITNATETQLDTLVEEQARENKKERSLLRKKIEKEGWIGIRRLDYRWSSAITILKDINKGRNNVESQA